MLKLRIPAYIAVFILLVMPTNAAVIHGTIYDLSLKKINNAKAEISTSPKQLLVAQNGSYSFNAPNGKYTISAQLMQKTTVLASTEENITIKQDGDYVLDLILFPDIEEGVEDINLDFNGNIIEPNKSSYILSVGIFLFLAALALLTVYYLKYRIWKKEKIRVNQDKQGEGYEDALEQVINIIKKEGGRTTQRYIRQQVPLSEAKISLIITELEHKGIVERIKKGRGNIIILKKQ